MELTQKDRAFRIIGKLRAVSGADLPAPYKLHAVLMLAEFLNYGKIEDALVNEDTMKNMLEVCGDLEALIESIKD